MSNILTLFPYQIGRIMDYPLIPIPDSVWVTGAPIMWAQGFDGLNTKVGIIDTGINNEHQDLKNNFLFRRDYILDNRLSNQFNPHGTHVAGIICANGLLKGVIPNAKFIDYRVLDINGFGTYDNIIKAINDAILDECRIINMSLGGDIDYQPFHDVIIKAIEHNIIVVVASGNDGPNTINYPAAYPETLSCGAINFDSITGNINLPAFPWFSSTNDQVDICADGYNVLSTLPNNTYGYLSGTSMAAPNITGICGIIYSMIKKKTQKAPTFKELYSYIKTHSIDILDPGKDNLAGSGFATFYPEIPKKINNIWQLPNMTTGLP